MEGELGEVRGNVGLGSKERGVLASEVWRGGSRRGRS